MSIVPSPSTSTLLIMSSNLNKLWLARAANSQEFLMDFEFTKHLQAEFDFKKFFIFNSSSSSLSSVNFTDFMLSSVVFTGLN